MPSLIFVEFTVANSEHKDYFVGRDLSSILADTANGTNFGGNKYSSYRVITEDEAKSLGLKFFDKGIAAVLRGSSASYFLDSLKK